MSQDLIDTTAKSAMDETMEWGAAHRSPQVISSHKPDAEAAYKALHSALAEKALAGTIAQALAPKPYPKTLIEQVIEGCHNRGNEYAAMMARHSTATVGERLVIAQRYEIKQLHSAYRCAAEALQRFRPRRSQDLIYENVLCAALVSNVEVGYEYHPAEIGDDEQPGYPAYAVVVEVWVGGVNIAAALTDPVTEQLCAEIEALHRGGK